MGTVVRADISSKNPYWIGRHRYYELKHFCLQYPSWKRVCSYIGSIKSKSFEQPSVFDNGTFGNPTADGAESLIFFKERIAMIEKAAKDTDSTLSDYILKGVTEGVSYDSLKSKLEIPCCRDTYYVLYRKFFWILSKERQ